MSSKCVVCEADLSDYIGHANYGDLYLTCTECGRVVCTDHDGIDWDIGACPKCKVQHGLVMLSLGSDEK